MRGKRRRGLLLLSFPDENELTAQWNVDIPKGRTLRLKYAFVPCETDLSREQKYVARQRIERRNREAIRLGKRAYDD